MADVLKYGWVRGGREGVEKAVSNSQYFNRLGGAFVAASGPQGVKLVTASTDQIMGWAEVPREQGTGTLDYWLSDTTAGKDKVYVITDPTAIFAMPALETRASLAASIQGEPVCASASGSTTTLMQKCDCKVVTTAGNMQLEVIDVDTDNKVAYVRMLPYQRVA